MFFDSHCFEQDIVLRTEAKALTNLHNVSPHIQSINVSRSAGRRQKSCSHKPTPRIVENQLFWVICSNTALAFSVCRCWAGGRKGIRPVKTEWWGAGVVICLERGANLHTTQLMPLPFTVSCFSKIQIDVTFLVPAHPGSPGQRALKRVCVMASRPHRRVLPLVSHFEYIDHRAWDPGFYQVHGFLAPIRLYPKRQLDRFIRFGNAHQYSQRQTETDRHTDRATFVVVLSASIRPKMQRLYHTLNYHEFQIPDIFHSIVLLPRDAMHPR